MKERTQFQQFRWCHMHRVEPVKYSIWNKVLTAALHHLGAHPQFVAGRAITERKQYKTYL